MTVTYPNIRIYLDNVRGFQAGDTDHLRLLIPDLTEIRSIELEPVSEDGAIVSATWKLASLTAMMDLSGLHVSRNVDRLIVEGEPLRIILADILLAGTASLVTEPDDEGNPAGDYTIPTGGSLDLALNPGEGVRIVPRIQGSTDGIDVSLNRIDPATGALARADLVDTRGYTQELLDTNAASAEEAGNLEEAAVWRSIVPDDGFWEIKETYDALSDRYDTDWVTLIPPHNYTDAITTFRITLTSRENSAVSVYVNVSVAPETNPVEALLEEARAKDAEANETHTHTLQYVPAVAPVCSTSGNVQYYTCTVCGMAFSDPEGTEEISLAEITIPATGLHTYGSYVTNNDGTHSKTCSSCGASETADCSFGAWTDNHDGTHSATCTVCGYQITESCELEYTGYSEEPGCVRAGKEAWTCSRCGRTEERDAAALGHLPGDPVEENRVEPTETEEGGYDTVVYCRRCGEELDREHTTLPPTESAVPVDTAEPTEPTLAAAAEPLRGKEGEEDV